MAKHKARSLRASTRTAGVLIACAALLATLFASSASALSPGITVKPKNADVLANCTWKVTSVNAATVQVQGRLSAQAQPATLFGYGTNVYTQVACFVYDAGFNLLQVFAPFKNGPTVPTTGITPILPFSSSYHLCGYAYVKKSNGTDSFTPTVCI